MIDGAWYAVSSWVSVIKKTGHFCPVFLLHVCGADQARIEKPYPLPVPVCGVARVFCATMVAIWFC